MRARKLKPALFTLAFLIAAMLLIAGCEKKDKAKPETKSPVAKTPAAVAPVTVEEPQVAGRFYPAGRGELSADIESYLSQAKAPDLGGTALGFMTPHAGYPYSGPVAAYVYKEIARIKPRHVVIMGPSHHSRLRGVFVLDKDLYRTPLGEIHIDKGRAEALAEAAPWIVTDERIYQGEHSIEVQIPFLQQTLGNDTLINVIMLGYLSDEQTGEFARILDRVFGEEDTIFIASTDMSHGNYPPYMSSDQIRPVDLKTLDFIKAMDIDTIERGVRDRSRPLCGGMPVVTLMKLFRLRGGHDVQILHYADSGDATGDHSQVVGYGAAAFVLHKGDKRLEPPQKSAEAEEKGYHLTDAEKIELLKMARAVVDAAVKKEKIPEFETSSPTLKRIGAAFVTLKNGGELRGCIGTIVASEPLFLCVQRRALDAALHDSRFAFNRITPAELKNIEVEISVLTPIESCRADEVVVGRDGVLLSLGSNRGVFLPQVPGEQGWDHDQYLSHLCRKAGIYDFNCWKSPDARLDCFRAIVFSESERGL